MKTHQITLRNVDPLLKQRIARNAKLNSQSMNSYILNVMSKKVGLNTQKESSEPSWKKFIGTMTEADFNQSAFDDFEKIDPKMWR